MIVLALAHTGGAGRGRLGRRMILAAAALWLTAGAVAASPAQAASAYQAYVANTGLGKIGTIATDTNTLSSLSASSPLAMAITPNGATLYVCNYNAGTVTPISLPTGAPGRPITVGASPSGIAITPDGSKAYVTNSGAGTVTAINLASGRTSTITVGSKPWGVAITPDGSKAYVVNQTDGTVTPIAVSTDSAGPGITVGTGGDVSKTSAIAITPDGSTAYAINYGSNSIVPIAVATNTAGAPITGFTAPSAIAIAPDGRTAYIAEDGAPGHLVPMDLSSHALGSAITVGVNPYGVSITPDQKTAYVADFGAGLFGAVTPVSLATGTPGSPIMTFGGPSSVVIGPDQAPVASLAVTPAPAGSPSFFDASSSAVRYGSIASYAWNFGDGQTAITSTPTVTHTYASSGTYTTTVTETDSAGTSMTQVFTGQTVSRNGTLRAQTAKLVQVPPRGAYAPRIVLKVPRHLAVAASKQVAVTVYCPAPAIGGCRGTVTLRLIAPRPHRLLAEAARCGRGCRPLGSGTYVARAGHKATVHIHVSADVSRLLRSRRVLRAKLTATNVVGGAPSTSSKTITLGHWRV